MISSLPKEPINQTYFGALIGGLFLYFSLTLELIGFVKYFLIIFSFSYLSYMVILSCFQMFKNTKRYLYREDLDKELRKHELEIEKIKTKK
ncbi:hypothetical protein GW931_03560 [archaeon]|nr:hypothetical protein [archaeon]